MTFYIKHIHLWFRNKSEKRTLTFLPGKVNIITGAKSTGKTSIIDIIDYCLLSSRPPMFVSDRVTACFSPFSVYLLEY